MNSEAYVTLVLPEQTIPTVTGRLRIEQTGRDIQASFVYGRRYCQNPDAIPLDPLRLPLDPGRTYESPGLWGPLGIFRDASPDYWGRMVIEREMEVPELPEMEYLLRAGQSRVGALGFQPEPEQAPIFEKPIGFVSLPILLKASRQLEANEVVEDQLLLLLRQGTSIGGARPKATVVDNDTYWLAKFPSRHDRMDMPAIEYATLKLARAAGINTPPCRLLTLDRNQHVMMTRRFDRLYTEHGWQRYHYMSGLTALGLNESENAKGSYPGLADSLRQLSTNFKTDAEELFRRMVFNILITNDDDHLRNHAFLYLPEGWRLSPVYDLVPHAQVGYARYQSIIVGKQGRVGTLKNALTEAGRFGLTDNQAIAITDTVRAAVSEWKEKFADDGVTENDIELLKTAFLPESALQGG
jgi:serine/threonine-protein kinase HipA